MPGFGNALGLGYGLSTIIWGVAIIVVIGIIWRGRRSYVPGTLMVLNKFRINQDPSVGPAVEIIGRASGIVSWVLTVLNLNPENRLIVSDSEVSIRSASLSGIEHTYIPMGKITATVCGYQRSILALGFL